MEPILALMLAVASYTLGWMHRHRKVDAQRAEAERLAAYVAARSFEDALAEAWLEGYHTRNRVDLLTGRRSLVALDDRVGNVPEYLRGQGMI